MRRNQVSISIERFGDEAPDSSKQITIQVYADANNIYEALAAAYYEALDAIQEDQPLPSFGDRSHSSAKQ